MPSKSSLHLNKIVEVKSLLTACKYGENWLKEYQKKSAEEVSGKNNVSSGFYSVFINHTRGRLLDWVLLGRPEIDAGR